MDKQYGNPKSSKANNQRETHSIVDPSDSLDLGSPTLWTRRELLVRSAVAAPAATRLLLRPNSGLREMQPRRVVALGAEHSTQYGPSDWDALAQSAVRAARAAGAQYADARLTRTIQHTYTFGGGDQKSSRLYYNEEKTGIGVRALINGYWGFAACPSANNVLVERLAQNAVAQAKMAANGSIRTVELGQLPIAAGIWGTPITIDPFDISIEEKQDFMNYWQTCASRNRNVWIDPLTSHLDFTRQTRVVATSEGSHFTQKLYESGGQIICKGGYGPAVEVEVQRISTSGTGWELFLGADIPEQFRAMPEQLEALSVLQQTAKPLLVGRYTLVCDGTTMATLLDHTLGVATQLDRALGYEANAAGTSFLDDPLAMLGVLSVASPSVTITANRSAPAQLATVRWDDEGVVPEPFILIKDGTLMDFQTTREQAAWLAPYYLKRGWPVHSHGCAAAGNALLVTMQHPPNLALEPSASEIRQEDLIADVKDGLLLTAGKVLQLDAQARNGLLVGNFREIKNGRLGRMMTGGAVLFNTIDLWRRVVAVGGPSTQKVIAASQYPFDGFPDFGKPEFFIRSGGLVKGQPAQTTSRSISAVAATIANQPLIDVGRGG